MHKILFFYSQYCAVCAHIRKIFEEVLSEFDDHFSVEWINDENPLIMREYNVLSLPTIIIGTHRLSSAIDQDSIIHAILDTLKKDIG